MSTFEKKITEAKEAKRLSQIGLATELGVHHSIIGKYERDKVKPSIDVVKRMAKILDTTGGYLLGETKESILIKDSAMHKHFNEINDLPNKERQGMYYVFNGCLPC
jgi:transcriptional regulator with XRE-family HTH domain